MCDIAVFGGEAFLRAPLTLEKSLDRAHVFRDIVHGGCERLVDLGRIQLVVLVNNPVPETSGFGDYITGGGWTLLKVRL